MSRTSSSSSAWSTCSSSSSDSLEDNEINSGYELNSLGDTFLLLCHDLPLNAVINELLSLKMGYEKVDYVIKLLENNPKFKELVYETKEMKSNEQSEKWRIRGNDVYKDQNYSRALKYYTRSIALAENNSLYLALAYGNRSALLFEKRYYQGTIKDIEMSLCCECPEQVKEKLLIRKNKAEFLIHQQKIINFCNYFPQIQHKHPKIDAASSSIEIQQNDEVGRYIVAAKNIKIGEVISVEKPYVQQIRQGDKNLYCNECLIPCFNLIPCRNCASAMYCSEGCMQKAYNNYHKYSCEISGFRAFSVCLKTFLIGQSEGKNEDLDDHYRSDRFKEIIKLSTNENKRNPMHLLFYTIVTCQNFLSLKYNTEFFKYHTISEKEAKDILYKLVMIHQINHFGFQTHIDTEIYATGIFSFNSLFNHSCAPNCQFFFHGDMIVLRAMEDIKKGQECNISYRFEYEFYSTLKRQQGLYKGYQFKCKCKACEENWSLPVSEVEPLSCCDIDANVYTDKNKSDLENVEEVINDIGPMLNSLVKCQPSITFSYLKNVLIDTFKYVGNKTFFPSEF